MDCPGPITHLKRVCILRLRLAAQLLRLQQLGVLTAPCRVTVHSLFLTVPIRTAVRGAERRWRPGPIYAWQSI